MENHGRVLEEFGAYSTDQRKLGSDLLGAGVSCVRRARAGLDALLSAPPTWVVCATIRDKTWSNGPLPINLS